MAKNSSLGSRANPTSWTSQHLPGALKLGSKALLHLTTDGATKPGPYSPLPALRSLPHFQAFLQPS